MNNIGNDFLLKEKKLGESLKNKHFRRYYKHPMIVNNNLSQEYDKNKEHGKYPLLNIEQIYNYEHINDHNYNEESNYSETYTWYIQNVQNKQSIHDVKENGGMIKFKAIEPHVIQYKIITEEERIRDVQKMQTILPFLYGFALV